MDRRVGAPTARWLGPLMVLSTAAVDAQGQCEITKLVPKDGGYHFAFGMAVDMTGDTLLIASPKVSVPWGSHGMAYVYRRAGADWTFVTKLVGEQPDGASDGFACDVAVSGDVALIGAYLEGDGYPGAAYVFRLVDGIWTRTAKISAVETKPGDRFGLATDLDGDVAVIGTKYAPAAFVFRLQGGAWVQEATLLGSDTLGSDDFGYSVGIDGDIVVVGARWADSGGLFDPGAAYVFERIDGAWVETAKLLPTPQHNIADFGTSVAISRGTIVVGSPGANAPGIQDSGAAFVFERDADGRWVQTQRLIHADAAVADSAGTAVAIDGDTIVVGIPGDDDHGNSSGSAAVFVRSPGGEWVQSGKISAADGTAGDRLADAVAVSGDIALLGAFHDEPNGDRSGSAYVFAVGPDADGDGVMDACVCTGDVDGDWRVDQADLGILLSEYNIIPQAPLRADLNGDGAVNQQDLGILLAHFGAICP